MSEKILISKPGINVGTVTNPNDLIFSSDYNTLKYDTIGSTTVTILQSSIIPDDYSLTSINTWGQVGGTGFSGFINLGNVGGADCQGAMRITNVQIPQGATVTSATANFYVAYKGSGSGNVKGIIFGIDEDNTGDFSGSPMSRTATSASANIDISLPTAGEGFSINITTIVNEIIGRGGWTSGNALAIKFFNQSSPTDVYFGDDVLSSTISITYNTYGPMTQENVIASHNLGYVPFFTAHMKNPSLDIYYNLPFTIADAGVYLYYFIYATTTQLILRTERDSNSSDYNFTVWYKIFKNNLNL